jgi:hypothetical protein
MGFISILNIPIFILFLGQGKMKMNKDDGFVAPAPTSTAIAVGKSTD